MGRVAAAVARRGHEVTAVEKDPDLVARSPAAGAGLQPRLPVEHFQRHVTEAGLVVEHLYGTYDLEPPAADYVVAVLRRTRA